MNRFPIKTMLVCLICVTAFLAGSISAQSTPKWVGAFFVKGKVGLKWQPVAGATEYSVHRMEAGGEYAVIATTDKTNYFDTDFNTGTEYTYKISCKGADGAEVFSGEKSVSIPASQSTGNFKAPSISGARQQGEQIMLRWSRVPGAIGYNVYRSLTSGGPYTVVGNATSVRHADAEGLENGNIYYYVITALDEQFEETEYSKEFSVQFGALASDSEEEAIELEPLPLTLMFELNADTKGGALQQPVDVEIGSDGSFYVADALNQRVVCFDQQGKAMFEFGEKTRPGMEASAPDATFSLPMSIHIDDAGMIYVGDPVNHEIQVFDAKGNYQKRFTVESPKGTEDRYMFRPNGITDWKGQLLVADAGQSCLFLIDKADGKVIKEFAKGDLNIPSGVVVTPKHHICVVDVLGNRVQVYDEEGTFLHAIGEMGTGPGQFGRPSHIAVGEDDRLWVTDMSTGAIQVFADETEIQSSFNDYEGGRIQSPAGIFVKGDIVAVVSRLANTVLVFKIG